MYHFLKLIHLSLGLEKYFRNSYLSISLFYDGHEEREREREREDKESGNSDCILLSHLEINEATHKRGGET